MRFPSKSLQSMPLLVALVALPFVVVCWVIFSAVLAVTRLSKRIGSRVAGPDAPLHAQPERQGSS
jgi:urea transporter